MKTVINKKPTKKGIGSFYIYFYNIVKKEPDNLAGISHLIEHCICEPLKEIEQQALTDAVQFNACTSEKSVYVVAYGLDEHLYKYKDWLVKNICGYIPSKEVFEREKSIVISEYNMYMAQQLTEFSYNLNRKYYNTSRPLGTLETLQNIDYDTFLSYYKQNFIKPTNIFNFSKDKYSTPEGFAFNTEKIKYKSYKFGLYNNFKIEHNNDYANNDLIYIFKDFPKSYWKKDTEKLIYLDIFSQYLSMGITSPLNLEVREKLGNVYSVNARNMTNFSSSTTFIVSAQTKPEYVETVTNALKDCLNKHSSNPDEELFNNALKAYKNKIKLFELNCADTDKMYNALDKTFLKYIKSVKQIKPDFDKFKSVLKDYIIRPEFLEFSSKINN